MANKTVIVKILNKEYQVVCPPGQQAALEKSAAYLDNQMRRIRDTGKVIGIERIAVMAALNISNELIQNNGDAGGEFTSGSSDSHLKTLNSKLDEALQRFRQLEIG